MNKDDLIKVFLDEVSRYNGQLTEETIKYINGEVQELVGGTTVSKMRNIGYMVYDKIAKELKGDNKETAKRIFYVLYKTCNYKILRDYDEEKDIKNCFEIGLSFNEVLEISILRNNKWFSSLRGFEICRLIYEEYKSEAKEYCNDLISNASSDMLKRKYSELYPIIYFAMFVYFDDKNKNKVYLGSIVNCVKSMDMVTEVTIILHKLYSESKELLQVLKDSISKYPSVNETLYYICLKRGNYLGFLKSIDAEVYPYYALITSRAINVNNDNKLLRDLYISDRDIFYKTYEFMKVYPNKSAYSLFLLGIMLSYGDGKDELTTLNEDIIGYIKEFSDYKSKDIVLEAITTNSQSILNNAEGSISGYGIKYNLKNIVSALSVLYDYNEIAKKYIDIYIKVIFGNKIEGDNYAVERRGREIFLLADIFITSRKMWLNINAKDSFIVLNNKGLTYELFFLSYTICQLSWFEPYGKNEVIDSDFISQRLNEKQSFAIDFLNYDLIKKNVDRSVFWLNVLYYDYGCDDYDIIFNLLNSKSKKIQSFCENYIKEHEKDTRERLEKLIPNLKGDAKGLGKRVIKNWDNERKYGKDFNLESNQKLLEFVDENYDKDNEKLISWIDQSILENVRFKDLKGQVPVKVIKYILIEYMALKESYRIKTCDKIVERINSSDLQNILQNVYDIWFDDGADTKKKNITIPYCIYGSDEQILGLNKQLLEWAKNSRGALGAFVINSIALNGGNVALLMVDNISNKFPNAMVKKSAKSAFSYASKVLGIPLDELSDKIIPSLEFSIEGERIFSYGERKFKVTLAPDFSLSIFDIQKNKIVKSMPKPNDKDDKVLGENSKKEFTALKKQIKAVYQSQKMRLEKALMNGRKWSLESFNKIFVQNPIMHNFAIQLIWGVYDDENNLIDSFRYMEDGTFNTVSEEEYTILEGGKITLIHPIELKNEEILSWKQQLEDYEIIQPIDQLVENPISLKEEDLDGKILTKYSDKSVTVAQVMKIAKKYDMQRGEVLDAGCYDCYHIVDKYLNVGVKINVEGMFVGGMDFDEDVLLGDVIFYNIDDPENIYDDIKENDYLDPRVISKRFVSSVLSILDEILS